MFVDFHCHILPFVDHGSQNVEQSLSMLENEKKNGVEYVVASSHFYSNKSTVENYLSKRKKSIELMEAAVKGKDLPKIIPAAEVHLTTELLSLPGLGRLAIGNTNYILIEMPYGYWSDWVYNALYKISMSGLIPVLAHIERYIEIKKDQEAILKLAEMDILTQVNAYSITQMSTRRKSISLIKNNRVHFIGTDWHDEKHGEEYKKAFKIIEKKCGADIVKNIKCNSLCVIENKVSDKENL